MIGGARDNRDHNGFTKYFDALDRYINKIKVMVHKLPIVDNFASIFTMISNHEGAGKRIEKETIVRFIKEYMISSMIDISESTL